MIYSIKDTIKMGKKSSSKLKVLFSDTIAFTISNFASKLLIFFLLPLYTAFLTTEEYGIADLITNTINMVHPILTLGIMESTLRFTFDSKEDSKDVLFISLVIISIGELIAILATPLIKIFNIDMFKYWGWFLAILGGLNLQQVLSQYTKGIGKTKVFAISGILQTLVVAIINILGLTVFHKGLTAYLLAMVIGYVVTCSYLLVAAHIKIRTTSINVQLFRDMLKFSIPTIPNGIAWWINTSADKYIIIAYLGVAASGVYSVAYKIPSILTLFTNIFVSAWTISAIKNVNEDDNSEFQTNVYNYFNVINVLACSGLILFSKPMAKILFSKNFFDAWKYVPFLLIAYLFAGLAGFLASSFRAAKYTSGLLSSTAWGAVVNIVLNLLFVKLFGNLGAAFTTLLGFAITFYIRSKTVKKVVDLKTNLLKDTFIYMILMLQACVITFECPYKYFVGTILFVAIVCLYYKYIINIFKFFGNCSEPS